MSALLNVGTTVFYCDHRFTVIRIAKEEVILEKGSDGLVISVPHHTIERAIKDGNDKSKVG